MFEIINPGKSAYYNMQRLAWNYAPGILYPHNTNNVTYLRNVMCLFFVCWDDEHFDRNTTVIRCHGYSTLTVLPRLTKLLDCRRHTILYYIIDAIQC